MKQQSRLEIAVMDTISYFGIFRYAATAKQIHKFIMQSAEMLQVKQVLDRLYSRREVSRIMVNGKAHYGMPGRSITQKRLENRELFTNIKLTGVNRYIRVLAQMPWIRFVGLSGSLAMNNAKPKDDVDLFIITASKRIWIGRLTSIVLAELFGVRRRRNSPDVDGRVCLNMFFDEGFLLLPADKRTLYGAHEVLQMRPLPPYTFETESYRRFIQSNSWVYELFPNAHRKSVTGRMHPNVYQSRGTFFGNILELVARALQKMIMKAHTTTERISDEQLWFFPQDFESSISNKYTVTTYDSKEAKNKI